MPVNAETPAHLVAESKRISMPIHAETPTHPVAESKRISMPVDAEALTHLVIDALEDRKAQHITVLDVHALTDVTDVMVIACGRSTRQVKATAEHVIERSKEAGCRPLGVEGLRDSQWVLVDLCDVVLHVMTPETRETYQLEKLWGGAGHRQSSLNAGPA